MKLLIKYLKLLLKGIPIGVFIGQVFFTISIVSFKFSANWESILYGNIISALIGAYCYGTSITYTIEKWSLLKQTLIQWTLLLPFLPLAWYLGWMPRTLFGIISFIIVYILVILGFWLFYRAKYTKYVNEVNESLKAWKPDK